MATHRGPVARIRGRLALGEGGARRQYLTPKGEKPIAVSDGMDRRLYLTVLVTGAARGT